MQRSGTAQHDKSRNPKDLHRGQPGSATVFSCELLLISALHLPSPGRSTRFLFGLADRAPVLALRAGRQGAPLSPILHYPRKLAHINIKIVFFTRFTQVSNH